LKILALTKFDLTENFELFLIFLGMARHMTTLPMVLKLQAIWTMENVESSFEMSVLPIPELGNANF
jgi:hypothetical protein